MLDIELNNITTQHKRIIQSIYECNPSATLEQISNLLNEMPEMATCFVDITPDLLKSLGYSHRNGTSHSHKNGTKSKGNDEIVAVTDENEGQKGLTQTQIRAQLERRHTAFERRISEILGEQLITDKQAKALQMLSSIDEKIVSQILDLMQQEAVPLLPQAIIIRCLIKLGVPEPEIDLIDTSIDI